MEDRLTYIEPRPRFTGLLAAPTVEEVRKAVRREVPNPLTGRHQEILKLMACGTSNKEIGYLLGISERTVKTHAATIMQKLTANDRTHAVVIALRHDWIGVDGLGSAEEGA